MNAEERKELGKVAPLIKVTLQRARLLMAAAETSPAEEEERSDRSYGGGGEQKW